MIFDIFKFSLFFKLLDDRYIYILLLHMRVQDFSSFPRKEIMFILSSK